MKARPQTLRTPWCTCRARTNITLSLSVHLRLRTRMITQWRFSQELKHTLLSMTAWLAHGGTSETTSASGSRHMYSATLGWQSSRSGSNIYRNCRLFGNLISRTNYPPRSSSVSGLRASSMDSYTMRRPHSGTLAYTASVEIEVLTKSSYTSFSAAWCIFFVEKNRHGRSAHHMPGWYPSTSWERGLSRRHPCEEI